MSIKVNITESNIKTISYKEGESLIIKIAPLCPECKNGRLLPEDHNGILAYFCNKCNAGYMEYEINKMLE